MMPPSNTPPDGDFVRYIERISAVKAPPEPRARLPASGQAKAGTLSSRAAGRFKSLKAGIELLAKLARGIAAFIAQAEKNKSNPSP